MKLNDGIQELKNRYGWWIVLRAILYPITVLFTTPFRLVQTLIKCHVLLEGKDWSYYNHFSIRAALNAFFYHTRALNIQRYGRSGKAPFLGLGDYPLARCFHYSLISLFCYWKAGAVTLLVGMFGFWMNHVIWFTHGDFSWIFIVLLLILFSTTFYANTFGIQNYNVLGWLFVPIVFYGLVNEYWIIAGLALFCTSFGSFTSVVLMNIIFIIYSILNVDIYPILALVLADIKLLSHFYPFIKNKDVKTIILNLSKAIGVTNKDIKYRRKSSKKLHIGIVYYFILYVQFIVVFYFSQGSIPTLMVMGIAVFLINALLVRFADMQSVQMLIFCIATMLIITNSHDYILLISYWLLISPLPKLAFSARLKYERFFDVVPKFEPLNLKPLMNDMESFLSPMKEKERILMAFDDPNDIYENIFDGYRHIVEIPLYIAADHNIHLMPDWWAIFDLNYKGAPDFWGRDVQSVIKNSKQWKSDAVIVYQKSDTKLDSKWEKAGFQEMGHFSWNKYSHLFQDIIPVKGELPDWWLLKHKLAESP